MDAIRHGVFRTPSWRWDVARGLVESGRRPSAHYDAATRRAVRYPRAARKPSGRVRAREFGDIRRAEELFTAGGLGC